METEDHDFTDEAGSILLEQGKNPDAILNHFKSRQGSRASFLKVSDDLMNARILPDSLKKVEEKAIEEAQSLFESKESPKGEDR